MNLCPYFYLVIFDTWILNSVLGNESNVSKFTKIDCVSIDPKYLANVTCRVKASRRDLYLLNIRGTFIKPADNLVVRIRLFKKSLTFKPFLVDVNENLCDFLSKKHISSYMRIIGGIYMPYSNLNSSCPVTGNAIFKDMPMNASTLPSIWPSGEYRLDIILKRFDKVLITLQIYFTLQEKTQWGLTNFN